MNLEKPNVEVLINWAKTINREDQIDMGAKSLTELKTLTSRRTKIDPENIDKLIEKYEKLHEECYKNKSDAGSYGEYDQILDDLKKLLK